jgi:hypothetical protein
METTACWGGVATCSSRPSISISACALPTLPTVCTYLGTEAQDPYLALSSCPSTTRCSTPPTTHHPPPRIEAVRKPKKTTILQYLHPHMICRPRLLLQQTATTHLVTKDPSCSTSPPSSGGGLHLFCLLMIPRCWPNYFDAPPELTGRLVLAQSQPNLLASCAAFGLHVLFPSLFDPRQTSVQRRELHLTPCWLLRKELDFASAAIALKAQLHHIV